MRFLSCSLLSCSILSALLLAGACADMRPAAQHTEPAMMSASAGEIAEGRRIVELRCASCHAVGPDAKSRHPEAPPLSRLSEEYPVTALEEAFAEGVIVGHPDMPEFSLSPEQIRALLGYLESIQINRGA